MPKPKMSIYRAELTRSREKAAVNVHEAVGGK